jgi:hypothetical protein
VIPCRWTEHERWGINLTKPTLKTTGCSHFRNAGPRKPNANCPPVGATEK